MTSPAKLSNIAKLVCVDSLLFGNDYQTSSDIQSLADNVKSFHVKEAWPENGAQKQHAVITDTKRSQKAELTEIILNQEKELNNDLSVLKEEVGPVYVIQQKEAVSTCSNSIQEYLIQLLETGFFSAVSEEILTRLVEHYPFRLTNRLLLALLPPYAREINLFNCTERLTLMGLVEGLKKCSHLHKLNLQNCSQLLHSDLFTLIGLMNNQLSVLILEGNSNVTDEIVQTAIRALPNLTSLNISCCGSITDDVFLLDPVLQLKRETSQKPVRGEYPYRLSNVDMSGISSISSVAVRHLSSLCGPNLRQLNLAWSTVDSTALFYLAGYNFPTIIDLVLGRQSELTQEKELKEYITELREIKELYLIKDKQDRGNNSTSDMTNSPTTAENTQSIPKTLVEKDIANLELLTKHCGASKDTEQAVITDQDVTERKENVDSGPDMVIIGNVAIQLDQENSFYSDNTFESGTYHEIKNSNTSTLNSSDDSCDLTESEVDLLSFTHELSNSALNSAQRIAEVVVKDENDTEHENHDTVKENDSKVEISHDANDDNQTKFLNYSNSSESDKNMKYSSSCDSLDMKNVALEKHKLDKETLVEFSISTHIQVEVDQNSLIHVPQKFVKEDRTEIEGLQENYIVKINSKDAHNNRALVENFNDQKDDMSDDKDESFERQIPKVSDVLKEAQQDIGQVESAKDVIYNNKSEINEKSVTESLFCQNDLPENSNLTIAFNKQREQDEAEHANSPHGAAKMTSIFHKSVSVKPVNNNSFDEEDLCSQVVFRPGLVSLDITNIKFVNRKLGQLCLRTFLHKNPALQKLELSWKGLTEEFLKDVLPNLNKLVEISLEECTFIQNGGLAALLRHCQSLRSINLRGVVFIKDMAMTPMYTMSNLTKLNLAESEISDTTLFRISNRLNEKLTDLDLSWCEGITEKGVNYICMKCSQLKSMVLRSCPVSNITLHVMAKNCPNMRELLIDSVEGVSSNEFSDTGLLELAENLFLLETLDISWNLSITNLAVSSLMNNLSQLKEVHMKGLKQITCTPFLPIVSGVRDNSGVVKEFWVDEYCNNLQTANCLRRSTVFAPNLRILDLEYSDLVEDKRLELIVKVCRGSLEVTDYYGRYLVPDESSNLVISTASCHI